MLRQGRIGHRANRTVPGGKAAAVVALRFPEESLFLEEEEEKESDDEGRHVTD